MVSLCVHAYRCALCEGVVLRYCTVIAVGEIVPCLNKEPSILPVRSTSGTKF
jgi:hypothetical protein